MNSNGRERFYVPPLHPRPPAFERPQLSHAFHPLTERGLRPEAKRES